MRLAVPSEGLEGLMAQRSGHFGHASYFTILEIEDNEVKNIETVKNADHDAVGCGGVIQHAMTLDLDALLVIGMGRPPFTRFTEAGIKVYVEKTESTVGGAVKQFLAGNVTLMSLDQACVH